MDTLCKAKSTRTKNIKLTKNSKSDIFNISRYIRNTRSSKKQGKRVWEIS